MNIDEKCTKCIYFRSNIIDKTKLNDEQVAILLRYFKKEDDVFKFNEKALNANISKRAINESVELYARKIL